MMLPSPEADLDVLSAVTLTSPTQARAVFPEQWTQGRGLFGGLVAATLIRAIEATAPGRALRSLTAEMCGPVQPGEATFELSVLRVGNAVTTSSARLVQNGEVLAHGVGVMGLARTRELDGVELTAPTAPPWRDVETIPIEPPLGPSFAQFFEFRPQPPLPFSGGSVTGANGWVRPKNPGTLRDSAYLAACIDAHWPAFYGRETAPRPMATIAFTFQPFQRFDGLNPEAPYLYRARVLATDAGYCVEDRELWGEDGRLLALNQQTFVVIK